MLHPLLVRQLERCGISQLGESPSPEAWSKLLDRVSKAYREADEGRYLMERSLGISSAELLELNRSLSASRAELAAERDRLVAIFASLADGLFVLDTHGECILANPAAERLLGFTREELGHRDVLRDVVGLSAGPRTLTESRLDDDAEFQRADGTRIPVSYAITPIHSAGNSVGAVLAFRDIAERKRALQVVERERRQLLDLIANAPTAMAMFDRSMRYVAHSERWIGDYGLHGQHLIGASHYEVFPDIPQRWRDVHQRTLQGEVVTCSEDVFERADGSRIALRWAIHPWHTQEGDVGGIVMVTDRIDDLVNAREEALEMARVKAEFLANMSHEIRTPMNGVIGMTELLLGTPLNHDQREFAETIRHSADTLLTIINDVLDFSKIEAGKLRLESIEFDPRASVYDVVDLLMERGEGKGLEIVAMIHHDVPSRVRGDPGRLRQVLLNLVGNAIKFTAQGEVVVTVRLLEAVDGVARLHYSVQDTGVGIDAEGQAKLFQSFSQTDGSTTRRYGGTGLGLAICKQLSKLMEGEIGVESRPGKGSTFWFTVRVGVATSGVAARTGETRLRGLPVLIVDDHATQRSILEREARVLGLEPHCVADAAGALAKLQHSARAGSPFRIALVDMCMPGVDGLELARRIRADPELAVTQLVLLCSMFKKTQAPEVSADGFRSFLVKPVRAAKLEECLLELCTEPLSTRGSANAILAPPSLVATALRHRPRVLLAEDNVVNRKVAARMLERMGIAVDVATNGHEAIEAVRHSAYQLVLMDCQMPELDGFEATAAIRRAEGQRVDRLPIVALTANAMSGDRERCLAAGMDDYITKPFKGEDLLRVLGRWIRKGLPVPQECDRSRPPIG